MRVTKTLSVQAMLLGAGYGVVLSSIVYLLVLAIVVDQPCYDKGRNNGCTDADPETYFHH